MREGLITVPKCDNNGKPLDLLIEWAMETLAKRFGGVTAVEARGSWVGPDGKFYNEPVIQLITAYDPDNRSDDSFLAGLAVNAGIAANQLAMYVRYASGEVEIIEIKQPEAMPAAA